MEKKRKEDRNMCADLLKVRWKNGAGVVHEEFGTLEDISSTGACVQLEESINPGTPLTLSYPSGKFRGRVKYCIEQGAVYLVGIAFAPGYRWSRSQYKPSHLLQFRLAPVKARR